MMRDPMVKCEDCNFYISLDKIEHPYFLEGEGICFNPEINGDLVSGQSYCRFWEKKTK